jgi:2-polyprenyl-6-methoxyphenol hydroxylase-like FAD-dependent oxidoreductase
MAVWSSQRAGFAESEEDEKRRVKKILESSQPVLDAQGKPRTLLNPQGQQLRVMVVGGGPVGLMAGLQLVQRGAHVDIFENTVGELESLRKQILYLRPLSVDLIKSVPDLAKLMNSPVGVGTSLNEWLELSDPDPEQYSISGLESGPAVVPIHELQGKMILLCSALNIPYHKHSTCAAELPRDGFSPDTVIPLEVRKRAKEMAKEMPIVTDDGKLFYYNNSTQADPMMLDKYDLLLVCDGARSLKSGVVSNINAVSVAGASMARSCDHVLAGLAGFFENPPGFPSATDEKALKHPFSTTVTWWNGRQVEAQSRFFAGFEYSYIAVEVADEELLRELEAPSDPADLVDRATSPHVRQKRRDFYLANALQMFEQRDLKGFKKELFHAAEDDPTRKFRLVPIHLGRLDRCCGTFTDGKVWMVLGDAAATPHFLTASGVNAGFEMIRHLMVALACRNGLPNKLALEQFQKSVFESADNLLARAKPFCQRCKSPAQLERADP